MKQITKKSILGLAVFILYIVLSLLIIDTSFVQHLLEKHGFLVFIAWWAVFIGLVFWVDKLIKKEQPERNVSRKQTVAFYCSIIVMVILLGVIEKVFLKDFVIGKSRLVLLYELPFIILWSLATGLIIRKFFPNKNKQINKTL